MSQRIAAVKRSHTLGELAQILNAELEGNAAHRVDSLGDIKSATSNQLSFVASASYQKYLADSSAGGVLVTPALADGFVGNRLLVEDPYLAYARASALFDRRPPLPGGVHPSAVISEGAVLGADTAIGANAVIGKGVQLADQVEIGPGCVVGDNCHLGVGTRLAANVTLYHGVAIGARCIIHAGAVIGSDGFGFAPNHPGWTKIHQLGGVRIGDDVEIGAGTAIDRGAIGETVLADGVKLDNLVHIAHNVRIGKNTAIAANCAIAGSTTIGENCTFSGAVGVNGHIVIGDNVHFTGMSMVTNSINEPGSYSSGIPATATKEWRKNAVRFKQLNALANRVKQLAKDKGLSD